MAIVSRSRRSRRRARHILRHFFFGLAAFALALSAWCAQLVLCAPETPGVSDRAPALAAETAVHAASSASSPTSSIASSILLLASQDTQDTAGDSSETQPAAQVAVLALRALPQAVTAGRESRPVVRFGITRSPLAQRAPPPALS
ncbi:MAG: hypothetical protein JXA67_04515 [Micromonosporaceae bacterium]|nr:hypothetical protein [Micromonosporaceae bacterium]